MSIYKLRLLRSLTVYTLVLFLAACGSCNKNNNNGAPDMATDAGDTGPMVDADMGGPDMDEEEVQITTCSNQLAPPASGLCDATAGSNDHILFQVGSVLAPDRILENGTVLVDTQTGRIACAGCDCGSNANAAEATVVTCADGVLSPSLINPHDHITFSLSWPQDHGPERYEHRHDWRRGIRGHSEVDTSPGSDSSREGVLYGELRMLFGAATSIAGSSGRADGSGLLRNLDVADDLEGLSGVDVDYRTFPLGDSDATLRDSGCAYPDPDSASRAENAGIYLPHIAEGIDAEANNEFRCLSSNDGGGVDVVNENTSIIHGIGLTAPDIAGIAADGAKLVWSPRSNIDLYGNTARVTTFKHFGVTIALGTDWSASGSMNVLRELKCADYLNETHYDRAFSDRELWQMSTYNAAVAMGAENQIGLIQERRVADLALFDGRDQEHYRAVIDAETEDVHLVMRGGTPLLGDANVVEAMVPAAEIDQCETIDVCGEARRLCAERDAGMTRQQIEAAVDQNAYPLFFCDEPEQEPSCVPARPEKYTGQVGGDDDDGDGIANPNDLCPAVFTPVRPLDQGQQPDVDSDMTGDDCDVCPLAEDDMCAMFDPDDRDGDGIPNSEDNCASDPNEGQANSDGDQFGDVCDPCPDFDNTETIGCPATVYQIRAGDFGVGDQVFIEEVVVTAASDVAYFVQVPDDASYYAGLQDSGLFIYSGSGGPAIPAVGDVVNITGQIDMFGDTLQLTNLSGVEVTASGHALPDFTTVDAAEAGTGGARAEELRGTLVRVRDVSVSSANPDDPDDFGEFEVDGALRVDDTFYLIEPDPQVGDEFAILQGVLTFSFSNSKLLPRSMSDVVTGPPSLDGLEPNVAFLRSGTTGVPVPMLEVVMTGPALGDTDVDLSYSGGLSGPATVTVPDGDDRVSVSITAGGSDGSVTAAFDGDQDTTDVIVYDDATTRTVAALDAAMDTMTVNSSQTLTVELGVPGPTGGQSVDLAYAPGSNLSGPASVTVPADQISASFDVTAGASEGNETVTASIGGSSADAMIQISAGAPNCLIFSEYIEGSGSNNKAFELYNCSPGTLDLSDYGVCLVSNGDTACSQTASLPGMMLPQGEVLTVCKTTGGSAGDPVSGISDNCDLELGSIANFNGNDRLVVFVDTNSDDSLDSGDTITDAFGQIAVEPGSTIWGNTTYRRCDFTQFDGMSAFDVDALYTTHPEDDASDFGTAPTEGCP